MENIEKLKGLFKIFEKNSADLKIIHRSGFGMMSTKQV